MRRFGLILLATAMAVAAMGASICGDPDAEPTASPEGTQELTASATAPRNTTEVPAEGTPSPAVTPLDEPSITPTPTPAIDEEPTNVPDAVPPWPTASSDAEPMLIGGNVYVDARPATGTVVAYIEGQQCGDGQSFNPAGEKGQFFARIASDTEIPGCGVRGAIVGFTINGRTVDQTVAWAPGSYEGGRATFSSGSPFAIYRGTFRGSVDLAPGMQVVPYIDGKACGDGDTPYKNLLNHARWTYEVVVDPEELHDGCGREGALVVLVLVERGVSIGVIAGAHWQTLPPVEVPFADFRGVQ